MKKLSEFSMKEIHTLIISLAAELKTIANDGELKSILKSFADARGGKKVDVTILDAIFVAVNSLLLTNERALWTILAAFTQSTPEEVQEMNNLEVVTTIADFLSIEAYRKLFSQAFRSATIG